MSAFLFLLLLIAHAILISEVLGPTSYIEDRDEITRAKNVSGRHGGERPLFEGGELADFVVFGSAGVATRGREGGGSL